MKTKKSDTSERDRDRAMILDPGRWPCWPYLPIKRLNHALEDGNLGLLVASETPWSAVYCAYLYGLPKTREEFLASKRYEYPTVDALLDDGWVVD